MPNSLDLRTIRAEALELTRAARVSSLRFTALYVAVTTALSLVDAAASRSLGGVQVMAFSVSFVSVLVTLIGTVLGAGYALYCLRVQRGEELPYESLFDAFPFAGRVAALSVLYGVLVGTGLSLFVVPGVVLALAYSHALFHLCEDPDMGVFEALRRSRTELRGYKGQLLALLLSFLPLLLLYLFALLGCAELLSPLLPDTLTGDLAYVLVSGVLTGAVEVFLRPQLVLARVLFYRRVTGDPADESPE